MKFTKLFTCFTLSTLLLTGCASNKTVDLEQFKTQVQTIESAPYFMELDSDMVSQMLELTTEDYVACAAFVPMMNVHATEIMLFTYENDQQKQKITSALDTRLKSLEETWGNYLPEQFELVKDYDVIDENMVYGYIIGEDAFKEDVKKALSASTK